MAKRILKRRTRAMVMIFVVIMIAAITTIIAASVDLAKSAVYRQKQSERDAKWQYCLSASKAMVTEDMVGSATNTQSFTTTVNNMALTVTAALDNSWNDPYGERITVTGVLDGKSKTTNLYVGRRSTVQPCQFGLFVTHKLDPDGNLSITGDVYCNGTVDASTVSVTGDAYGPDTTAPNFLSLSGSYRANQPAFTLLFDDARYAGAASITTSGGMTLSNPTSLLTLTQSQLRYHTGNLTIQGLVTGEITIYVDGNVVISNPSFLLGSRLVVICHGDVSFSTGSSDAFVICSGKVLSTGANGLRTINGSLACADFQKVKKLDYAINFNSYFVTNTNGGTRYWIPGQW